MLPYERGAPVEGLQLEGSKLNGPKVLDESFPARHTVDYNPVMKRHLASRNELQGHMWCKCGHVPR